MITLQKKEQKKEQTPRGALIIFSFSLLFERKAPRGEPTTREGERKGLAAKAERDASQHAVGGIAPVFFFFHFCVSTSGLNTARPTFFFFLETPRVRWKRSGGAISELFCGTPREAFTPFFTVHAGSNK